MKEITANTDLDIEKEFKIEAGPGAGKTRFLIHHTPLYNFLKNKITHKALSHV